MQYAAGRERIREARGDVVGILVNLIEIMCSENSVYAHLDSSLHPHAVISELLRDIIVSGKFISIFYMVRLGIALYHYFSEIVS